MPTPTIAIASARWGLLVCLWGASLGIVVAGTPLVRWTAQQPDLSKRAAGYHVLNNTKHTQLYAEEPDWQYVHAAMVGFSPKPQANGKVATAANGGMMTVVWKQGHHNEDRPGQRVAYVQSTDGVHWDPPLSSPPAVMFPNISLPSFPVHLFAEPFVHVNGRMYAAASPIQFCLYPDEYEPLLLLRRVYADTLHKLGPLFWATDIPPDFERTSKLNHIFPLSQMDKQTQEDIATLNDKSHLPCLSPSSGIRKCEACVNGCQNWTVVGPSIANERGHYVVPGTNGTDSQVDVLIYRTSANEYDFSVRSSPTGSWSSVRRTGDPPIPDVNSNLNIGTLSDGRVFLVSNAAPAKHRDPLSIATTTNGYEFNSVAALATCDQISVSGKPPVGPYECDIAYPQSIVVEQWGGGQPGLYTVWSWDKHDIFITFLPLPVPNPIGSSA